ncbi:MAG: hypothetical protein ACPGYV_12280, partial [Phycisphaeraceae bacterium]
VLGEQERLLANDRDLPPHELPLERADVAAAELDPARVEADAPDTLSFPVRTRDSTIDIDLFARSDRDPWIASIEIVNRSLLRSSLIRQMLKKAWSMVSLVGQAFLPVDRRSRIANSMRPTAY